jgi:hypothetical protein
LRVESFNLFNRVQFGGPGTSIGVTPAAGKISTSLAGQITTQANDPREFQLAGRINF